MRKRHMQQILCVDKPLDRHSRALVHHKNTTMRTNMRGHSGASFLPPFRGFDLLLLASFTGEGA
jgi:hypothetical protein